MMNDPGIPYNPNGLNAIFDINFLALNRETTGNETGSE
jgi:hypothetical protein